MNHYRKTIRETLARVGRIGIDPRHVEAWMRSEHGTLDALSANAFRSEVLTACQCIDADPAMSERLAQSYAL